MSEICRFEFDKKIDKRLIKDQMNIAIKAARGLFGKARVKVDAAYISAGHRAVIDLSDEVGETIAMVFIECVDEMFGEKSYLMERVIKTGKESRK